MENLNLDEIEKYNPLTDTGKVLKQLLIEKIHEREALDELVKLTREQVEREKMRPDPGRLLRTLASVFVGEYDKFTKR